MLTTHYSVVSAVLVAKAAPSADMSRIRLPQRLQKHSMNNGRNKKGSMQATHLSDVSAVLVAKAAPNADMSLIRLFGRLQTQQKYMNKLPGTTSSSRPSITVPPPHSNDFEQHIDAAGGSSQRRLPTLATSVLGRFSSSAQSSQYP